MLTDNKKAHPLGADLNNQLKDTTELTESQRITKECRLEAWFKCEPQKRCRAILEAMGHEELTARQIAGKLGFKDLNAVKPRLSEMVQRGNLVVVGKTKDYKTGRSVSVFKAVIR